MINNPKYFFLIIIKMGYYEDNRGKLLEKSHDKYHNGGGKEKAT